MGALSQEHSRSAAVTGMAPEERARQFLAQGKWRKARDELKPLVKADRGRFLPLLVEANLGLAMEMLRKGQVAEARQVAAYLATIATPEQRRGLELELALRDGGDRVTTPQLLAMLGGASDGLKEGERARAVDVLVASCRPLTEDERAGLTGEAARLAGEMGAVHEALEALAGGDWERVSGALRAVGHRSAFRGWAEMIKGLGAFYRGEDEKAERWLGSLAVGTVPGRVGAACRLWLGGEVAGGVDEAALGLACRLVGCAEVGPVLARAEETWRQGKPVEAYRVFRQWLTGFPGEGQDVVGALTRFFFHVPLQASDRVRDEMVHYFVGRLEREDVKSPLERMFIARLLALEEADTDQYWRLRGYWEEFLGLFEQRHGLDPKLFSIAYEWLGERLARKPRGYRRDYRGVVDENGAVACLGKSMELDRGNLRAHLLARELYRRLRRKRDRYQLEDVMVGRFPRDKRVLVCAAEGCLERESYKKALDYLHQAQTLDQVDARIPALMVTARFRAALRQYQKSRPDLGRRGLKWNERWLVDEPRDFVRARWAARLRQGVMESIWGDMAMGEEWLAEGHRTGPHPAVTALFVYAAARAFGVGPGVLSKWLGAWKRALQERMGLGVVVWQLDVLAHWKEAASDLEWEGVAGELEAAFVAAVAEPFAREDALAAVRRAAECDACDGAVTRLIGRVLAGDKLDPMFRLLRLERLVEAGRAREEDWDELEAVLEEAGRRRDEGALRKAQGLLKQRDIMRARGGGEAGAWSEEDDDWEEDEEDEEDGMMPPTSEKEVVELESLLEQLRRAPEEALEELRRHRPPDMPEGVIEMLIAMARGSKAGGKAGGGQGDGRAGSSRRGKPSRAEDDPQQQRLF